MATISNTPRPAYAWDSADNVWYPIGVGSHSHGDMIPTTVVDAKGDIIAATAADTVTRLAVGSNNTVLMADSSTATGLKWATVDALPSQTGNSGKYLTTNGTTASWSTIVTDPTPSIFMLMGA